MGTLVVLLLLAVTGWILWNLFRDPDKNDDGKVDHQDVLIAAKEVKTEVKEVATKAVEKVKKARGRKPKAK